MAGGKHEKIVLLDHGMRTAELTEILSSLALTANVDLQSFGFVKLSRTLSIFTTEQKSAAVCCQRKSTHSGTRITPPIRLAQRGRHLKHRYTWK